MSPIAHPKAKAVGFRESFLKPEFFLRAVRFKLKNGTQCLLEQKKKRNRRAIRPSPC
jgi:hypothetical protein